MLFLQVFKTDQKRIVNSVLLELLQIGSGATTYLSYSPIGIKVSRSANYFWDGHD
jgi:hypothetical protein